MAETVTTVAQAPEAIAPVPMAAVPVAIVTGKVDDAGMVVPLTEVVLDNAAGRRAAARVPVEMFEALVVSVVAEAARAVPLA